MAVGDAVWPGWGRADIPAILYNESYAFLRPFFPYRLFIGQLVSGSDQYISALAHEAFHAYQESSIPEKFAAAERVNTFENMYPCDEPSFQADWQAELEMLARALRSTDRQETLELMQQFIQLREASRERAGFSAELITYEQNREWLEGLARYAELEIWRQAYFQTYAPIPETKALPDFNSYAGIESRWSSEIGQMTRMAKDEGDGRFYYSGMAQAFLLDRFSADWKSKAFEQGVWLEDLLAEAVQVSQR